MRRLRGGEAPSLAWFAGRCAEPAQGRARRGQTRISFALASAEGLVTYFQNGRRVRARAQRRSQSSRGRKNGRCGAADQPPRAGEDLEVERIAAGQPKMVVRNATKLYETRSGAVHALEEVSLEVREGEFLCILGPSGCGKTTLLWSMGGLHTLTSGESGSDESASRNRTPKSR